MIDAVSLSTSLLDYSLHAYRGRLHTEQYAAYGHSWLYPDQPGGHFAVYINGQRYDATNLKLEALEHISAATGIQQVTARFASGDCQIDHHIRVYANSALIETWQDITNLGQQPLVIDRVDSFSWHIPHDDYEIGYFTSDWGQEFELIRAPLAEPLTLGTTFGRSSKGQHPWCALTSRTGSVLSASIAWSGNWALRLEPLATGGWHINGGLHDGVFEKTLIPGESMTSPHAIMAAGNDLNAVSQQYARVGRSHWYPRNSLSKQLPTEWNHWWSYEDMDISERIFRANADAAAILGLELCTLDAGWFGPSDAGTLWHDYRGDWELVNDERFPQGIRSLSDYTHAKGMKFGLWCEIEGLGRQAALATSRPGFAAERDGAALGYVCFGSQDAQDWAYDTLANLITQYNPDWLKLDFNVDPGAGCSRTDHGHGTGDGLYEHYQGYYRTLDRVRRAFPEVVLEACSSGGLRVDLGMVRHTHAIFLSDADWPVHSLQVFWGASTMLAPDVCLQWSFSEWREGNGPPQQNFNPRAPELTLHQFDTYTRIAMLGVFGVSQKLPDLPAWLSERLAYHRQVYQQYVRRFVREADLYRLTDQPKRDGSGERWCAFQYSLPDRSEHLLFVFRLPGAEAEWSVHVFNMDPDRVYQIEGFDGEQGMVASGRSLMAAGLSFKDVPEEGSLLLRIH